MTKVITQYANIQLLGENLIEVNFLNDVTIDINEMNETLNIIKVLSNGVSYSILWLPDECTYFTMDAIFIRIKHNEEKKHLITSEAIAVRSIQTRLLETYYLTKNKVHYPIKLFKNKTEAIDWIFNNKSKPLNLPLNS